MAHVIYSEDQETESGMRREEIYASVEGLG